MNSIQYSIVIPCYNEEENLELLLNSIQPLSNKNLQIIIVDNGSEDNLSGLLKQHYGNSSVELLLLANNYGFSRANNFVLNKLSFLSS